MNTKSLCQQAVRLTSDGSGKRLALLSAGAVAIANLLLMLMSSLIDFFLKDATGLDAIDQRASLMTIQSTLQLVVTVASPFWTYGFYKVALDLSREEAPDKETLLYGFRRFWPLLRFLLLETLIVTVLTALAALLSSFIYTSLPFGRAAIAEAEAAFAEAQKVTSDPDALQALTDPILISLLKKIWPMYLLMAALIGVILVPWLYRLRMAPFYILDGENRAAYAMALSRQKLQGYRLSWFLLDLRWWWYYGLMILAAAALYLPNIIGGGQLLFWGITLASCCLQVLLQWQFLPRVQTSYALAYEHLRKKL